MAKAHCNRYTFPKLLVYLLISLAMITVPISTMLGTYSLFVWTALSLVIMWMAITGKSGFSLVFLSICLCEPGAILGDIDMGLFEDTLRYFYYFLFIIPVVLAFILRMKRNGHLPKNCIILSLLYIFISIVYSDALVGSVYRVVAVSVSMYVCCCDNIDIVDIFKGIFYIFLISIIYGAIDYHVGVTPYTTIFIQNIDPFVGIKRASGLLGNPLILCALVIICQALALMSIRYIPSWLFFLLELECIYGAIIVVSRSAVLAIGLLFICYAYINRRRIRGKYLLSFVFICLVGSFLITSYLSGSIEDLLYRFSNSDSGHRLSSLGTVANILAKHPLGIGFKDYAIKLQQYAGVGKLAYVDTLDNMVLTQFAHYGILAVFVLLFYFYPFLNSLQRFRQNRYACHLFSLYFISVLICAVIFDFEAYNNVNMFIYGVLGLFYGTFSRYEVLYCSNTQYLNAH